MNDRKSLANSLRSKIESQKPTKEQNEAIFTEELEYLLRAAPGSGKTWTSCRRFIWRAGNWNHSAGGLALLSFTNAAVREFHNAAGSFGLQEIVLDPNYVGTFDSFVERFILGPFGHLITSQKRRPRLIIAPPYGGNKDQRLNVWIQTHNGKRQIPAWQIFPFIRTDKLVAYRAARMHGGQEIDCTEQNPVLELFSRGLYTHNQRVFFAYQVIRKNRRIAEVLARRFPEIIVDEAQDTNVWLLVLLNVLRQCGSKITLIGDPDQCIYEFNMADSKALYELRKAWGVTEKPLTRSFRCNDSIAMVAREVGGNKQFVGSGKALNEWRGPFIVRDDSKQYKKSVNKFVKCLDDAEISLEDSAIICRGHEQIESIRGHAIYNRLQGMTKEIACATFFRDTHKNFAKAQAIVEKVVREMTADSSVWNLYDEYPESEDALRVRVNLWRFVRSRDSLPPITLNSQDWINQVRKTLTTLLVSIGIQAVPNLSQKIRKNGLAKEQQELPLFREEALFPSVRQETIHQVKGESIDGVLLLGSAKFFSSIVKAVESNEDLEERRLAYVAMTRARHTLVVGLPSSHFDKHNGTWKSWGFKVL